MPSHPQPSASPDPSGPSVPRPPPTGTEPSPRPGQGRRPRLELRPFRALSLVCAEGLRGHRSFPFWGNEDSESRFPRRNAVVEGKSSAAPARGSGAKGVTFPSGAAPRGALRRRSQPAEGAIGGGPAECAPRRHPAAPCTPARMGCTRAPDRVLPRPRLGSTLSDGNLKPLGVDAFRGANVDQAWCSGHACVYSADSRFPHENHAG